MCQWNGAPVTGEVWQWQLCHTLDMCVCTVCASGWTRSTVKALWVPVRKESADYVAIILTDDWTLSRSLVPGSFSRPLISSFVCYAFLCGLVSSSWVTLSSAELNLQSHTSDIPQHDFLISIAGEFCIALYCICSNSFCCVLWKGLCKYVREKLPKNMKKTKSNAGLG